MITVLFTIPKTQYEEEVTEGKEVSKRRKLPNSKILNTLKTRCLCEAMVAKVEDIVDAYYDETILGAWQFNGLPIGYEYEPHVKLAESKDETPTFTTTIEKTIYAPVLDEEGNETKPPIRTVIFNKKEYVKYLPEVVKYKYNEKTEERTETSRTKATEVKFLHNWAGWKDKVI